MDWSDLPSVVLVQMYSALPWQDRLRASSSCKNWRESVFQVPLSPSLTLNLQNYEVDGPKVKFLTQHFVHKVTNLTIIFNPTCLKIMDLLETVLTQLALNRTLECLKLRFAEESLTKIHEFFGTPSNSAIIFKTHFARKVIDPVLNVLANRNCLESFSFPLVEELAPFEHNFYESFCKSFKNISMRNMYLATLRLSANAEVSKEMSVWMKLENTISGFGNLKVLSIDHDILNDNFLGAVGARSSCGGLAQFNVVATAGNKNVSNSGWLNFVNNNPQCRVGLTLIGNGVIFDHDSNLIFQCIPITHFRALYCKELRMATLNSLISWNESSLELIELEHENYDWMDYIQPNNGDGEFLDPIIYAAWRCRLLSSLKIGFLYCGQSLVGIARLKGPALTSLEIPKSKVIYHNIQQLSHEVGKALCRAWKPIDDSSTRRKKTSGAVKKFVNSSRAVLAAEGC